MNYISLSNSLLYFLRFILKYMMVRTNIFVYYLLFLMLPLKFQEFFKYLFYCLFMYTCVFLIVSFLTSIQMA